MSDLDILSEGDWAVADSTESSDFLNIKLAEPLRHVPIMDVAFSLSVLPIVAPLILVFWALIKIGTPSASAFFIQRRYGLQGQPFDMIKLRTMVPDADQLKAELIELSEDKGPGFKIKNDPRITRLGRFLRKSHIDELPQFFNVLRGDMSIVGPRANSYHPSEYEPWQLKRLSVKPGITGSWQIAKDKPMDFTARCRLDIEYIENRSFLRDARIIVGTVFAVLRAPGD
ncbi:MAG: sugar transferase [Pseudomonadota bacterium]